MAFGRIKDAVTDLAETLRRVFSDPACGRVVLGFPMPAFDVVSPIAATACACHFQPSVSVAAIPLVESSIMWPVPVSLSAALHEESGLAEWDSKAKSCAAPLFRVENCGRMAVPALPRRPRTFALEWTLQRAVGRAVSCGMGETAARSIQARFQSPRAFAGLHVMMDLPVSIQGEDWQALSKALWMRYTFQFVKGTGENIRNVDILGLFRVPKKGVKELRHDPHKNCLLVRLEVGARGSETHLFILARRKSDRTLVSCYLEEG